MTTNIDRARDIIEDLSDEPHMYPDGGLPDAAAQALDHDGLLRPDPSSRYDGDYQTTFGRDEDAGDGPYIDASVDKHHPAPKWETVHRANVSIDIGGQHGYHNLHAYATAEWCREAASVLLDVADEVDRRNKETADKRAEKEGTSNE